MNHGPECFCTKHISPAPFKKLARPVSCSRTAWQENLVSAFWGLLAWCRKKESASPKLRKEKRSHGRTNEQWIAFTIDMLFIRLSKQLIIMFLLMSCAFALRFCLERTFLCLYICVKTNFFEISLILKFMLYIFVIDCGKRSMLARKLRMHYRNPLASTPCPSFNYLTSRSSCTCYLWEVREFFIIWHARLGDFTSGRGIAGMVPSRIFILYSISHYRLLHFKIIIDKLHLSTSWQCRSSLAWQGFLLAVIQNQATTTAVFLGQEWLHMDCFLLLISELFVVLRNTSNGTPPPSQEQRGHSLKVRDCQGFFNVIFHLHFGVNPRDLLAAWFSVFLVHSGWRGYAAHEKISRSHGAYSAAQEMPKCQMTSSCKGRSSTTCTYCSIFEIFSVERCVYYLSFPMKPARLGLRIWF